MTFSFSSWSDVEKVTLANLVNAGWSSREIARHLKRPVEAVSKARRSIADAEKRKARVAAITSARSRPDMDATPRRIGEVFTGASGIRAIQLESGPVPFVSLIHADQVPTHTARPRSSGPTFSPG